MTVTVPSTGAFFSTGAVSCLPASVDVFWTGLAGSLCYMGLTARRPIRGAIDIAWGVELHKGELYGAAVARAYELESEIAKYPRVVVGAEARKYLEYQNLNPDTDNFAVANKAFANLALSLLTQDEDGEWIVNYLGVPFRDAVTTQTQREMYPQALAFVEEQLQSHRQSSDAKLVERYERLQRYFKASPLAAEA